MSAADNKRIIAQAFDGLARADPTAFIGAMADDVVWIIEGQSKMSGRFEGKDSIQNQLVPALFANFATPYRNIAEEVIAERDRIVVLARGEDYNNDYCFVLRMRDGKIIELREYCDTALAERVLEMKCRA